MASFLILSINQICLLLADDISIVLGLLKQGKFLLHGTHVGDSIHGTHVGDSIHGSTEAYTFLSIIRGKFLLNSTLKSCLE